MIEQLTQLAERHGFKLEFHKPENRLLRFRADRECAIDVWYSSMTAALYWRGSEAKYQRNCSIEMIEEIFIERAI